MDSCAAIAQAVRFVSRHMASNDASHDIEHCKRVSRLAKQIALEENHPNPDLVAIAGIMHDVLDHKYVSEEEQSVILKEARQMLCSAKLSESEALQVMNGIESCGFSKQLQREESRAADISSTLKCVQDADMLDAIGAVGIARCFTFGGAKHRPLYDPDTVVDLSEAGSARVSSRDYLQKGRQGISTVDHFYEKLLHIKSMLQTNAGKRLAQERHEIMEKFLEHLVREIQGLA